MKYIRLEFYRLRTRSEVKNLKMQFIYPLVGKKLYASLNSNNHANIGRLFLLSVKDLKRGTALYLCKSLESITERPDVVVKITVVFIGVVFGPCPGNGQPGNFFVVFFSHG